MELVPEARHSLGSWSSCAPATSVAPRAQSSPLAVHFSTVCGKRNFALIRAQTAVRLSGCKVLAMLSPQPVGFRPAFMNRLGGPADTRNPALYPAGRKASSRPIIWIEFELAWEGRLSWD